MRTTVRRALAAAGVTIAACGAMAGTAAADTLYPTDPRARDFAEGTKGWVDVSRECSLLGAIPLPIPLLCSSVNEHSSGEGNPPGSLRSSFQSVANLGGLLFDGTAVWRSPQFTVAGTPEALTGATLSFDRKAVIEALIDQGGEAVTKVELVQTAPVPARRTVLEETLTAQNSQFGAPRAVPIEEPVIEAGATYVLEFSTTFTSTAIQLAQGSISAYYDNVQLRAHDGTDTLNVPPDVTTLLATDVTANSATFNATVSPKGLGTQVKFQVRETGDQDFREILQPGAVGDGTTAVRVTVPGVGDLKPCENYEYRAVATNDKGTTEGNLSTFSTSCAPRAVTLPAAPVAATTAGLNSAVSPNGPESFYKYQLSVFNDFRENATFTTEERSAGSGRDTKQPLNEPLSGLRPQTKYFYRVLARNELGSVEGNTVEFTTPQQSAPGAPGTPGAPGPRGPSGVNRQDSTLRNNDPRALLRIRQSQVSVGLRGRRSGQIRLRVFCRSANGRSCAGTVKLRTIGKMNPSIHGRRVARRKVTFATFEYQLAQGKSGVAIGQMTSEKVELLRQRRGLGKSIGVTISVQTTDSVGNTQTIVQNGRLRLVSSPR